jgi:hypothetical protein
MRDGGRRAWGGAVLAAATVLLAATTAWGDDERTWRDCTCRLGGESEAWYRDRTCGESEAAARDDCRRRCDRRHEGWWPGCGDCTAVDTGTPCRR